ncbi:MAG TPA: C40 family peptidase [Fimbriimonas sp.]|nr:C40 family peptidase [Fimbriimonas sp.]
MRFAPLVTVTLAISALFFPASASAKETQKVLGLAAQVLEPTKIYARASKRAHVYAASKVNDVVIVSPDAPQGWMKVFLNNGTYGYIDPEAVELVKKETEDGKVSYYQLMGTVKPRSGTMLLASRSGSRDKAAEAGLQFIGTKYVWGGNDINNGIDCSGFVQKLYGAIGLNLPRTAAEQANYGTPVTRYEDLKKGDRLYFWDSKRGKIGHTALYIGNWKFVHSSSSRGGVAVDDIRDGKWQRILMCARR